MNTSLNRSSQGRELSRHAGAPVPIRHVRSRAESSTRHPASGFSLTNTDGFWELTLDGRSAVLKQHPALFFVAWLLANAPAQPLDASDLASKVHASFQDHPDLFRSLPWLCRQQSEADLAKVFFKKQRALEAILDSEDELEPVKAEALHELTLIYDLQATYLAELSGNAEATAQRVMGAMVSLHASLTVAVDARGNPHPVIRAFAIHLLVYVLMPSIGSSVPGTMPRFLCAA